MADPQKAAAQMTAAPEPVYTAEEFACHAEKVFGKKANADLVRAAFQVNSKAHATLSEAKGMVERFMNRKVE